MPFPLRDIGDVYEFTLSREGVRGYNKIMPVYEAASEEETRQTAKAVAHSAKARDVFCLHGNLGAGKSVFARHFIRTLCGEGTEVPSPTFTLVQTYDAAPAPIWHFDLYRLSDPDEIFETGWEEALSGGITIVEWPERLGPYLPPDAIHIHIETTGATARRITVDDPS